MTVYEKRGKLVLSPGIEYPELVLYEFVKGYGVNLDINKPQMETI